MVIKFFCSESRFLKMGVSQLTKLISEAKASKDVITLEATVITGFELQAADECKEKCKPVNVVRGKGRIFFNIKKDSYPSVFKLRAVDNLFVVSEAFDTLPFTLKKEEDEEIIKDLVSKVDWAKHVPQWAELTGFKGVLFPKCARSDLNEPLGDIEPVCQRCLATLKTPENVPSDGVTGVESGTNPLISVEDHSSKQPIDNSDEKESSSVLDIDGSKLKTKTESDDEACFYSAEEDCSEPEINVKVVKDSNIEATPVQNDEVSESHNSIVLVEEQPMNGSEEEKLVKDLCQKSEMLSVSDPIESSESVEQTQEDGENSKKGKKLNYWQRRREEQKEGKGRKKVAKPPPKPYIDDGILKFRATCYRSGRKHSFDSNDAAMHFGGRLNDDFHWTVDLTRWDINVVLVIEERSGYVTFGLTKESFHRRNISSFGPTTLRSTLCYSLIRYAEPRTGDIVIDPLCGGGSISIEGAKGFPKTFNICGDVNEKCVERTKENMLFNTKTEPLNMDAFRWNAKALPLRDQSVDLVVTDLPFGLRMGKWRDNNTLYDAVLHELARVVRSGSGRAALLTYDKAAMIKALRKHHNLWREIRSVLVNHGGIRCVVFLLLRKALVPEEEPHSVEQDSFGEKVDYEENDVNDREPAENDLQQSVLAKSEGAFDDEKQPPKLRKKSNRNRKRGDRKIAAERKQQDEKTSSNPSGGAEDVLMQT